MKSLFLAIGILVSASAEAVVPPKGTFIPTECGPQEATERRRLPYISIAEVCVGRVVTNEKGATVPAFRFELTTGAREVLFVSRIRNLGTSPNTPEMVRYAIEAKSGGGERAVMYLLRDHIGHTKYVSGKLDVIPFVVKDFEVVFTPQGTLDRTFR